LGSWVTTTTASNIPDLLGVTNLAELRWESAAGADAYVIVRDGQEIAGPLRIEGSNKQWTDRGNANGQP
jgi:hypothetical protein